MAVAATGTIAFDVRELAAVTVHLVAPNCRDTWLTGSELERWMVGRGIARASGVSGSLVLTEYGVELAATVADLRF